MAKKVTQPHAAFGGITGPRDCEPACRFPGRKCPGQRLLRSCAALECPLKDSRPLGCATTLEPSPKIYPMGQEAS